MAVSEVAGDNPYWLLRPHWRLVLACFLGWFLDAFDQVALILVLPEIGKHFDVGLEALGLVITAQSFGRILGNVGWGWLADRYGRKLTFMLGVVWFAAFSGLTGLAWSYAALVVIQLFFGIGFGGEWTASAALLMESVPQRARAVASSMMMVGYEVGFLAAAGAQALLLPHFSWRSLFFVGVAPALLAIFIRVGIRESPVWLRTQEQRASGSRDAAPRAKFRMDAAAWQACLFMAALQFQTAALYSFYPTLLKEAHGFGPDRTFYAIAAYSIGSILGKLGSGGLAQKLGDRPTILGLFAITVAGIVPFASATALPMVMLTAFVVGASSSGVFALVPHYLSQRFSNAVRSLGMGLAYAVASGFHGLAGYAVPAAAKDVGLAHSIELLVAVATIIAAAIAARNPRVLPGRDMEASAV